MPRSSGLETALMDPYGRGNAGMCVRDPAVEATRGCATETPAVMDTSQGLIVTSQGLRDVENDQLPG